MRAAARWSALMVTALVSVGCATSTDAERSGAPEGATGAHSDGTVAGETLEGELVVFAAASLTDAFEELGSRFEAVHPDLEVTLNLASSATLATQILQGAPADVFASADTSQMDVVVDEGLAASEPATFTTNVLGIAVEQGNPLDISGLDDLTADDVVLVVAAPQVPAGRYATEMLEQQDLEVTPASLETDVRAALGKVALGEADAAIVYRSDVVTAGDAVDGVEIPAETNVRASYPITSLADAANPDAAEAFVAFVDGPQGREVLRRAGFGPP